MTATIAPLLGRRVMYPYPLGVGGGGALPNTDYGPDLRVWAQQPTGPGTEAHANGGVLYLPSRDPSSPYYAGNLGDIRGSSYVHTRNTGEPNNGWLTLKAWEHLGAVCDLSNTAGGSSISNPSVGGALFCGDTGSLTGEASLRTMFDDITFENGTVTLHGTSQFGFWYCRRSIPYGAIDGSTPGSFKAQYNAACVASGLSPVDQPPNTTPYRNVRNSAFMKGNSLPTGLRLNQGAGNLYCADVYSFGDDTDQCGDDGYYLDGTHRMKIVGAKVSRITHGTNAGALAGTDFHNDGLQTAGNESDVEVTDSVFLQHLQWACEGNNINLFTWDRIWQFLSDGVGMDIDSTGHNFTNSRVGGATDRYGNASYYRYGINGQVTPPADPTDSGWNAAFNITTGGTLPTRTAVRILPSGVTTSPAGGFGYMVGSYLLLLEHVDCPAVLWRAAHPIDSRDDVMSAWPVVGGGTTSLWT